MSVPRSETDLIWVVIFSCSFIVLLFVGAMVYPYFKSTQLVHVYSDENLVNEVPTKLRIDVSDFKGKYLYYYWLYNPSTDSKNVRINFMINSNVMNITKTVSVSFLPSDFLTFKSKQVIKVTITIEVFERVKNTSLDIDFNTS